jgi:hypothetical protein
MTGSSPLRFLNRSIEESCFEFEDSNRRLHTSIDLKKGLLARKGFGRVLADGLDDEMNDSNVSTELKIESRRCFDIVFKFEIHAPSRN